MDLSLCATLLTVWLERRGGWEALGSPILQSFTGPIVQADAQGTNRRAAMMAAEAALRGHHQVSRHLLTFTEGAWQAWAGALVSTLHQDQEGACALLKPWLTPQIPLPLALRIKMLWARLSPQECIEHYDDVIRQSQNAGLPWTQAHARLGLAQAYARAGWMVEAKEEMEKTGDLFGKLKHPRGQAEVLGYLGAIYRHLGQDDQARSLFEREMEMAKEGSASWNRRRLGLGRDYGALKLSQGELQEAKTMLQHASGLAEQLEWDGARLQVDALLYGLLLRQGKIGAAAPLQARLERALKEDHLLGAAAPTLRTVIQGFGALREATHSRLLQDEKRQLESLGRARSLGALLRAEPAGEPWLEALRDCFERALKEEERTNRVIPEDADVLIGPEASWFKVGAEEPVDLSRRGPMRRIVKALVHAHRTQPGQPLHAYDMLARTPRPRATLGLKPCLHHDEASEGLGAAGIPQHPRRGLHALSLDACPLALSVSVPTPKGQSRGCRLSLTPRPGPRDQGAGVLGRQRPALALLGLDVAGAPGRHADARRLLEPPGDPAYRA